MSLFRCSGMAVGIGFLLKKNEVMFETISVVMNALLSGGLVVTLVTLKSIKAKANANAKAVEIDNAGKLLENF